MVVLASILALLAGAAGAWLLLRSRETRLRGELAAARRVLELEARAGADQARLRTELEHAFKSLAADTLRQTNESFLELARTQARADHDRSQHSLAQLVSPLRESLVKVGEEVNRLEQARRQDYGSLAAQVRSLAEANRELRTETASLVTALRAPATRGRWGELQLRNAVEAAGMTSYCDFAEQAVSSGEDGVLRPDLVVRLPGGKRVVVDAKAPLQALLDAHEAPDAEGYAAAMQEFVRHVRTHVQKLTAKAYWQQFAPAPDFVVMYLPGESFYQFAIQHDPALLEGRRVILAGPANLITLLRAIALGWGEERVADDARRISKLGSDLYERLAKMTEHLSKLGRQLDGAVGAYNDTVGSFETRVLVSARRFREHGIESDRELPAPPSLERSARAPQTVELPATGDVAALPPADASAA
jgi:DNA recombination protein RmuC